jgi:hypothetical protein
MIELCVTSSPGFRASQQSDDAQARLVLKSLWQVIVQLPPLQRLALLLNFTDGDIEWFWLSGIVSIRDIGRTLRLTPDQFNRLWVLMEWSEVRREQARRLTDDDEKFALLWQQLPLNDLTIAALLETTQSDVIALRQTARQQLRHHINTKE